MINNYRNITISKSKFISLIVGSIIGIGILSVANGLTKEAHQDGWISVIFGCVYPMTFVIPTSYIIKKHPNDNILIVSKLCFGKFLGSIYNFIFLTFCIFIGTVVMAGYSNLMAAYAVGWLSPFKLITMGVFISGYVAYKGVETIAKISEMSLIITCILIFSSIMVFKISGSLNVEPIFGAGINKIMNGAIGALYSYSGIELVLIFYSHVEEKNKIRWYSIVSIIFTTILYAISCFVSIFYLGPDIVIRTQWPLLSVMQSVTITLINNFSYFFILMWAFIAIKCIAIYYYSCMVVVNDFLPKVHKKYICGGIYLVFTYFAMKFGNEVNRRIIVDKIIQVYTIINFVSLILICVILFKKDEKK